MRRTPGLCAVTILVVAALAVSPGKAAAQDLEPRAYTASPVGTNFLLVGGGRSSGDVITDPSLPLSDVRATVNSTAIGGGRTIDFFGRTALIVASFPYAWSTVSGKVGEEGALITRSGLVDLRVKFSLNLVGGRAVSARDFATTERPPTIVGASISMVAPTGQYDPRKLVNLGSNRWAYKPEVGVSRVVNKWTFDGYAGVWLFTQNEKYYPGASVRTQRPILAIQGHTSYTMKPRFWMAFNATWYGGGLSTIDNVSRGSSQRNARVGATLSVPLFQQQSLKVAFGKGAATRIGSNFTTVTATWQFTWLD